MANIILVARNYEQTRLKKPKKKTAPLDPLLFNLQQLGNQDLTKSTVAEKSKLTANLTALVATLCGERQCDLTQHLHYYQQIPEAFRAEYRELLAKNLKDAAFAQAVLTEMSRYPEGGIRPSAPFKKSAAAWHQVIYNQLTQELKSATPSPSNGQLPRLQWYNADGELEERILQPQIAEQLFRNGNLRDPRKDQNLGKQLPGERLVIPLYVSTPDEKEPSQSEPIAFCKFFPQFSGIQVQATTIEQQVTGHGLEFVVAKLYLPAKEGETPQGIPVLISQNAGIDLQRIAIKDEEQKRSTPPLAALQAGLDARSFTLKFLESLLCGHEDNQPANIADQTFSSAPGQQRSRLVGIDSDHAFQGSVAQEQGLFGAWKNLKVNRKNILYCLDFMKQPLDSQGVEEFLALDPIEVIRQVVEKIALYENQTIKNKEGNDAGLFTRQELIKLFKAQLKGQIKGKDECLLPGGFKPGALYELFLQFHALQLVLRQAKKKQPFPTPIELLKLFDRQIAHCYAEVLTDKTLSTATARFAKIQDADPEKETKVAEKETKVSEQEQKHQTTVQVASAPISSWARPSQFNATKEKFVSSASPKQSFDEFLLAYSKTKKIDDLNQEIARALKQYGGSKEHRYAVIAKLKADFEKGDIREFLVLCEQPGLSYLIEKVLKKVDAAKMIQNIGAEKARKRQEEILAKIVKHQHRFYELHLSHWVGLTDELMVGIAKNCPDLVTLDISHNSKISGKAVRAIANKCQQLKSLNLGHLTNLHTLREVEGINVIADRTSGPLVFPNLEHLVLDGCVNLTLLNTKIPKLKTISFKPYERYALTELIKRVAREGIEVFREMFRSKELIQENIYHFIDNDYLDEIDDRVFCVLYDFLGISCLLQLDLASAAKHFEFKGKEADWDVCKLLTNKGVYKKDEFAKMRNESVFLTDFIEVAQEGDLEKVRSCLLKGVSVSERTPTTFGRYRGYTALMFASMNGHKETVRLLLNNKASFLEVSCNNNLYPGQKPAGPFNALDLAAQNGHAEVVKLMLETTSVIIDEQTSQSALFEAVRWGNVNVVKLFPGVKFDKKNSSGRTVLMNAVEEGNLDMVKMILLSEKYISVVDEKDQDGKTVLMIAVSKYMKEILEIDDAIRCSLTIPIVHENSELYRVYRRKQLYLEIIKLLLFEGNASVNETDENDNTALNIAAEKDCKNYDYYFDPNFECTYDDHAKRDFEVTQLLVQNGAIPNIKNKECKDAIDIARSSRTSRHAYPSFSKEGLLDLVAKQQAKRFVHSPVMKEKLEAKFTSVKLSDAKQDRVIYQDDVADLTLAAIYGHIEDVKLLLETDNAFNEHDKYMAFIQAIHWGRLNVVQFLFDKNYLNHRCRSCSSYHQADDLLAYAAGSGNAALVEFLFDNGVLLLEQTSALIRAVRGGHFEVTKLLLKHGANVNARNDWQRTVLMFAVTNDHNCLAIVRHLLFEANASVNEIDIDIEGYTALMLAAKNTFSGLEIIQLLLEKDASVYMTNEKGQTAIDLASSPEKKALLQVAADRQAKEFVASCKARAKIASAADKSRVADSKQDTVGSPKSVPVEVVLAGAGDSPIHTKVPEAVPVMSVVASSAASQSPDFKMV